MCKYHKDLQKIEDCKDTIFRQEKLLRRCLKLFDYICLDCEYSPELYSAMETLATRIEVELENDCVKGGDKYGNS